MDEKKIIASQEEINLIENNAIDKIPINPTAQGFSGFELRKRLAQSVTGKRGSVLALLIEKLKLINDGIEGATLKNIIIDEKKVIIIYADGNHYEFDIEPITSQYIKEVNKLKPDENGKVTLNIKDIPNLLETLTDLQNKVNVLETDNTLIKERLDDVELDITRIDIKDTQQDAKINEAETELLRLAQDKFDKIPLNNVPFLNALGKVDNRYLDVGEALDLFVIVPELPPIENAFENRIYLVPNISLLDEQEVFNDFSEYFVFNNKWETLGSVGIDLEDYYNKDEIDLINNNLRTWVTDNFASKTELDGKVDKVEGKGLSANDFTNNDKNKLDGVEAGAEVNKVNSVNTKQGVVVLNQDDIGDGATYKRVSQTEKNTWNGKQNKLTAGTNITIDENNVISASGGMATVTWQDVENKPELYDKSEIDLMLGDIGNALDAILGV